MLVIERKRTESFFIGDSIKVTIVDIRGGIVRIGIEAPREVAVDREEVRESKLDARRRQAGRDSFKAEMGRQPR